MIATAADALWAAYLASRSVEDRNRLAEYYVADELPGRVIGAVLHGRVKPTSQHYVSVEGLLGAAHEGLIRGIEQYDPKWKNRPATFLSCKIQSAILDELRRLDPLSRRDRKRVNAGEMEQPQVTRPIMFSMIERTCERAMNVVASGEAATAEEMKYALRMVCEGMTPQAVEAFIAYHIEGLSMRDIVALRRARERIATSDIVAPPEKFSLTLAQALHLMGTCETGRHLQVPGSLWRALSKARDRLRRWGGKGIGRCRGVRSRKRRG